MNILYVLMRFPAWIHAFRHLNYLNLAYLAKLDFIVWLCIILWLCEYVIMWLCDCMIVWLCYWVNILYAPITFPAWIHAFSHLTYWNWSQLAKLFVWLCVIVWLCECVIVCLCDWMNILHALIWFPVWIHRHLTFLIWPN